MYGNLIDTAVDFIVGREEIFANQVVADENPIAIAIKASPATYIKKGEKVLVRLVKVVLREIEVLATNLMDKIAITRAD